MTLPLLPIRNTVLFPRITLPLAAGRPSSVQAIEAALAQNDHPILVVSQKTDIEEPRWDDIYQVGTRGVIRRWSRVGGQIHTVVEGVQRVKIQRITREKPFLEADFEPREVMTTDPTLLEALKRELSDRLERVLSLLRGEVADAFEGLERVEDPLVQAYLTAMFLGLNVIQEQELLETDVREAGLRLVLKHLEREEQILQLRNKISSQAQEQMSKQQREYFLREQLRAIQSELGESAPEDTELRKRAERIDLPEHARKELDLQLDRLARLSAASPEYQVLRGYVDLILDLPWNRLATDNLDLRRARAILDRDHYDLEEVKKRILEHLAVMKLNPRANAPILCFVGPPGTGKTSLGQSIAAALGRPFERTSLGGVHDEAELRGHRRTYVGAMPGRIIQAIRRAGVSNPLIMMDEIDKLGRDFRGDPAAALMEVLDPAQNSAFRDNYLDIPYDLSKVFFITTANALDTVPAPLLDRMEILELSGYSEEEKVAIARRYLMERQWRQAGISSTQATVDDPTLRHIIRRYTREAGLRQLERKLAGIARRVAMRRAEGETRYLAISAGEIENWLGPAPFFEEEARKELRPGVAAGLAWTPQGGEILYIETALLPGGEGLTITGSLGAVMKESVKAALSWVIGHSHELRIGPFSGQGLHVHVPAGAVPKDGPSAGAAIAAAIASAYTGLALRSDLAMTGEITLTGLVLPVGGVKEKILAAHRAGIGTVILPEANRKDLLVLPEELKRSISFVFVKEMDEVLSTALPASGRGTSSRNDKMPAINAGVAELADASDSKSLGA